MILKWKCSQDPKYTKRLHYTESSGRYKIVKIKKKFSLYSSGDLQIYHLFNSRSLRECKEVAEDIARKESPFYGLCELIDEASNG